MPYYEMVEDLKVPSLAQLEALRKRLVEREGLGNAEGWLWRR